MQNLTTTTKGNDTLLTTWGITLTMLNELSFNVGHNTYITK